MKEKLTGKFIPEPIRLVVPSKETAKKMITDCSIKTKLHVAACSGANATDGTGTMRPWWGFGGLALDQLNNPITSVERTPHTITDDAVVAAWMEAFVAAAASDAAAVTCTHPRRTKEGGGAFVAAPADTSSEAAIIWQVEEWVLDANTATTQSVNPCDVELHKTSVAHANPTPVKLKKAIERTEGAGLKITNWCRTHRPGLPWFATAPEGAAAAPAGPSSTTVVQGGRHGSLGAFVAHTEQAKMESTVMITKQEGRLSKLDEAMVKSNKMMRNLVMAIGPNDQQTKVLTGRVGVIGEKAD